MVEHSTENAGVAGSIPALGTSTVSGSSSVVEHFLAKEDVAGSNPVSRSSILSNGNGVFIDNMFFYNSKIMNFDLR